MPPTSLRRWRTHCSGCSKRTMAREYGAALQPQGRDPDQLHGGYLHRWELATLARRARACAAGQAGWDRIDGQGGRAAGQRLKAMQEHNAKLLALVSQAAVPGGVSGHEFTRPGGWLEPAQHALAVQLGASSGQGRWP